MKNIFLIYLLLLISNICIAQNNNGSIIKYEEKRTVYPQLDLTPYENSSRRNQQMRERMELEMKNEALEEKKKILECINTTNELYNSASSYPSSIPDGWHTAKITIRDINCHKNKIKTLNNKIVEFNEEGSLNQRGYKITISPPIKNGKVIVEVTNISNGLSEFTTVYFFDEIFKQ